jgi:hypothetical protein
VGLFTRKVPYTDVVIEALNEALDIDIKSEGVFKGLPVSNLEALICVFWMVERSLNCLPDSKREKAGEHMLNELLDFLRDDYSEGEIKTLVIPAFMKRTAEYSSLFSLGDGDEPRNALLRTSARMVENVFGEDEAHLARTMAVMLLWLQPILAMGERVKSMDDDRRIAW